MEYNGDVRLPPELEAEITATAPQWDGDALLGRVWFRDSQVWTGRDESRWLGWLEVADDPKVVADRLEAFRERLIKDSIRCVALLGMGGSSLFAGMVRQVFQAKGDIELRILDSTDPAQIRTFESTIDLEHTVFVVSSKSGTTLETRMFYQYFMGRLEAAVGSDAAPTRFCVITDAGSELDLLASRRCFRATFHGEAAVGGRYSALTYFGMLPAAVLGCDVTALLERAQRMADACRTINSGAENPGVKLGLILGCAARADRNKLTLVITEALPGLGEWIEQLIAESTGKSGVGVIPIQGECLAEPEEYGPDRIFVSLKVDGEDTSETDSTLDRLAAAGHPVIRFSLNSIYDISAECYRWEFATAVAGSILKVHPFNQPDVEGTKLVTKRLVDRYSAGRSPTRQNAVMTHQYETGEIGLHAPGVYGRGLGRLVPQEASMMHVLRAHLTQVRPGDYVALLAYLEWCEPYRRIVDALRLGIRRSTGAATTVGFGPRFLHSTGQAHKGGPQNGLYLVLSCTDLVDVEVPGESYSFGQLKDAQVLADEDMLTRRRRRYLRLHIDGDVGDGLNACTGLFEEALSKAESE
tara:strand:+ start:2122 stop:3870 length:1749 start_codon:yes stop_codon:yes gene_type:complete